LSSAARTLGRAATCARAWRHAEAPARHHAVATLARVLREEALRVLVVSGVPAHARDDLAQAVTMSVLGRIIEGRVEAGLEDGYLAVATKNRARDWHREVSGVYEKTDARELDGIATATPDPSAVLESIEAAAEEHALAERVRAVLDRAPERYRAVLDAVYLRETSIDALVQAEIEREPRADDPIAQRRRARARVDKVLQRARDWVRTRLVIARTTPPPPLGIRR
jgi:DNA-directed RNA polymerase specialized sigma24 family protein